MGGRGFLPHGRVVICTAQYISYLCRVVHAIQYLQPHFLCRDSDVKWCIILEPHFSSFATVRNQPKNHGTKSVKRSSSPTTTTTHEVQACAA